jgi:hypothetical protein
MSTNPDPTRIPESLWWFWQQCAEYIPGAKLGGIYANKSGYHNTVNANKLNWPNTSSNPNYSIQLPLDLNYRPKDKARAIDVTLSPAEMIKRTEFLKRAADHPDDARLYPLRSFIGTLDGVNVFCYIRDTDSGPWRFDGSRDPSHLWHTHKSFWTKYCADQVAAESVWSVYSGQTWEGYKEGEVAFRVSIQSSDADWNGKVVIGGFGGRFTARQPGVIHVALKALYPTEIKWTDSVRGTLSWDSFLNGIFGPDILVRDAAIAGVLQDILNAALDDGNVDVTLRPEDIAKLQAMVDELEAETRDAVADLGEGGAAQVREDA